jgi:CBS domain-containing protein
MVRAGLGTLGWHTGCSPFLSVRPGCVETGTRGEWEIEVTAKDLSLALDVDESGKGDARVPVARIAVVGPRSCTRDGSAQTITVDWLTLDRLEREVARLHEEIDTAAREAAQRLGGDDATVAEVTATSPASLGAESAKRERVAHELHVGDVMSRDVHSVGRNATLAEVAASLRAGGHRHIVVVDEEGELVGVLSQRDIFFGPLAWSMGQGRHAYEAALDRTLAKEVMREAVRTIDSGAPLQAAAQAMLQHGIGCLPVVDGDVLVGIVTESDLLELFA